MTVPADGPALLPRALGLPTLLPMRRELTEDREQTWRSGRPYTIEICPSQACNAQCPYCYAAERRAGYVQADPERVCCLLDEAYELGAREFGWLGGEPLCYRGYWEVTHHAIDCGYAVNLRTNGTLLPSLPDEMWDMHSLVRIHLDTIDPGLFEETYSLPRKKLYAICDWVERALSRSPEKLQFVAVVTGQNVGHITELIDRVLGEWGRPLLLLQFRQARSARGLDLDVPEEEMERILAYWLQRVGLQWNGAPPKVCARSSLYCRTEFYVDERFVVHPCDMVLEPSAVYRPGNLAAIWSRLRGALRFDGYEQSCRSPCRACDFDDICFGCRSIALSEKGDVNGVDPSCPRTRPSISV